MEGGDGKEENDGADEGLLDADVDHCVRCRHHGVLHFGVVVASEVAVELGRGKTKGEVADDLIGFAIRFFCRVIRSSFRLASEVPGSTKPACVLLERMVTAVGDNMTGPSKPL